MTTDETARMMADTLLHVAIFFNLEAWERDLTDEEERLKARVNAALDNHFGQEARDEMQAAISRDTDRALTKGDCADAEL